MKRKLLLISVVTILIALASAPLVKAAPIVNIYGYTDKAQYKPGETVTLKIWIHNLGPEGIFLKNITIRYPWYNPIWEGNDTITYATTVGLEENENKSETFTFTIPTDGRAASGYIVVTVAYTIGAVPDSRSNSFWLNIASVPVFATLESVDKIVTLLTVLVVLVILGAIIIAATIFLSTHRPQVTWKAEQKTE